MWPWTICNALNSYRSNFWTCRSPGKTLDIWNSRNGSNSYFSVGGTGPYFVNGKVWMRKVLSVAREGVECSILFFQHKWMSLCCQGQPCSGQGSSVVELRPASQSWEDSTCSHHFASGHCNRKFSQAQFKSEVPALNFTLRATILHCGGMGAKVKRQSLGCVAKVLFKGDCVSQISGCLIFPLSLHEPPRRLIRFIFLDSSHAEPHCTLSSGCVPCSLIFIKTTSWAERLGSYCHTWKRETFPYASCKRQD